MPTAPPQVSPRAELPEVVHATAISVDGKGLLIRGASGSGKSSLALEMISLGASLVADDQTELRRQEDGVIASCPAAIAGQIEARGIGILNAIPVGPTPLAAVLDLDTAESDRLPPFRETVLLGQSLPLLHKAGITTFPAALMQYLKQGRRG